MISRHMPPASKSDRDWKIKLLQKPVFATGMRSFLSRKCSIVRRSSRIVALFDAQLPSLGSSHSWPRSLACGRCDRRGRGAPGPERARNLVSWCNLPTRTEGAGSHGDAEFLRGHPAETAFSFRCSIPSNGIGMDPGRLKGRSR